MRTVFEVDVAKTSSDVAILVNCKNIHSHTKINDAFGFSRLLNDLATVE